MTNFRDRRSTNGKKPASPEGAEANARERDREARRVSAAANRRLAPGAQSASDWEAKQDQPLTRKGYLNVRASEEFSRREQSWIRRIWRWLTHRPPVVDMNAALAFAHAKSLEDIIARKIAEKQAEQDAATKAHPSATKTGASPEGPNAV